MKKAVDHNDLSSQKEYFEYIQTISWRGKLYKKFYLYPRLNQILKGKILDIGCGNGEFIKTRKGAIGCDINPFCAEFCNKIGLEAYHYSAYPLHFEDSSFDSIFLDNVLEHVIEPRELLMEINRLLKKNGTFLVGVPSIAGFNSQVDHRVFYDERKLEDKLSNFGMIKKSFFYTPFRSEYLKRNMNAHCLYGVFTKK